MSPFKINSLVVDKTSNKILMVIDRRILKDFYGLYVCYTVIEPHKPAYKRILRQSELTLLGAS